ncbi:TonB-dependent receptor [Chitinophagaceae bacterium LB-8]|uniref:TonB-dependent receptor n=1 Tax=Paraflavisolibacter caeni TaxID=2982496 RepID=A0A9X2XPG4_9BACT|nr:outer membrane beta-barrel protein [Paraflavisolibacter caeni]MCU7551263.1 TonB-dependent receptor [Paraflavisolibacter caeni]
MKRILFLVMAAFLTLSLYAQFPVGVPAGGKTGQKAPSIGHIYGKIVDSTGKPIAEASVMLMQNKLDTVTKKRKEVLLKGMLTKGNGDFNFEDLPIFGQLKLKISATGYAPVEQTVAFQMKMPAGGQRPANGGTPDMSAISSALNNVDKDLGNITLKTDVQQLQNVVVASSTGRLRMDIDKKVFSVDANIVSAGGTAVDVMKNVPSVQVDMDGNVTLRNASPQIYVDGRPTTLTLDQIPADAIESVEVITNPSAKYDASGGTAGILNIVLKKNKKTGYNGNVQAGVDKRGGLNGGGSFNLRQNKINLSLSTFGNQNRNRNTGSTEIKSLANSPALLVDQANKNRNNGGFLFGRLGLDYFITNRTTLYVSGVKVHGSFKPEDFLKTDSSYENGNYISYSERNANNNREFNAGGLQGGFKYLFPKQGEELTGDINFFSGKSENNALYNTDIYNKAGGVQTGNIRQQVMGDGTNRFLTMQVDYVKPFKGSAKLETGLRAQLRKMSNQQGNFFYDATSGQFIEIPSTSNNYESDDDVYAGYLSYTNSYKNFGYKLGLRAESSQYDGTLIDKKETFGNTYPISLFPSIFLSQKLKNNQELQLSYTRRINRPFFMQLIPFIDSTDQLNWSKGNPDLKPEFTNSLEASYTKTLKGGHTLLGSVYYKYSTDLITRYLDTLTIADGSKRNVNTYINANSSRSIGAELTSQNTITKWWDMNTNVNIYNSEIKIDPELGASQEALWSWFGKINSNFKLPKNFTVQLSGTYQSKTNLPPNSGGGGQRGGPGGGGPGGGGPGGGFSQSAAQGYIKSTYGIDAALKKSFLKNNAASVTFSVNDIFQTRRMDQYSESDFYIQNSHRLGDSPMMRLTFAFRFGKMDASLFKRKNTKAEGEGMQGAMDSM